MYHWAVKFAFGLKIRDVDCDFRLIRKHIFNKIQLESDTGVICVELIKKVQDAGFHFAQVGVRHYFRAYGKSQFFNLSRLIRVFFDIVRLWLNLVFIPMFRR